MRYGHNPRPKGYAPQRKCTILSVIQFFSAAAFFRELFLKQLGEKGRQMVRIPPPIWMFLFLAIAVAAGTFYPSMPIVHWPLLGIALVLAGICLGAWSFGLFRQEGTELNPASETNRKLVTRGPYRFTRNPMYLGLTIVTLGIAFWVGALPMFAVPILVFLTANFVHIPFEEAKMRRQFGAGFDGYTAKVRRWL
jgi:protein-S-isoprenylcysteine O-methyltransferase Ste14